MHVSALSAPFSGRVDVGRRRRRDGRFVAVGRCRRGDSRPRARRPHPGGGHRRQWAWRRPPWRVGQPGQRCRLAHLRRRRGGRTEAVRGDGGARATPSRSTCKTCARCSTTSRSTSSRIATPNHWHSLAAIWAMQAGKDVYVEKPVSHNVSEGRRMVEAARKYNRICQTGTQCRSNAGMRSMPSSTSTTARSAR